LFLNITTINSDQGLPNDQVHNAMQDKQGRLWISTPAGLACYNGNNIKVYDTRTGLDCLGLRTIFIAEDDTMWIGTDRGLESMFSDGSKNILHFNFDWKYGIAQCIFKENNFLFIGTSSGLLKLFIENDKLILISAEEMGLVSKIISCTKDTLLILSAQLGIIKYSFDKIQILKVDIPNDVQITEIKKTIDNFLLIGTTNGLYMLNDSFNIINHFIIPNQNKKVTAIAILGDEWWVAFGHIISLLKPTRNGILLIEQKNVNSIINDLFIDINNNVWLSTNNAGLKKISILRKTISKINCGVTNPAFSIKALPEEDNLLVSGDGFCSIISLTDKDTPSVIFDLPSIVWDTCLDPNDKFKIWLATVDGLYIYKKGGLAQKYIDEKRLIDSPNRVLLTRENEIWVGTISGLFKIKNGETEEIFNSKGNAFGYVYCLALDNDNKILIGTLGQGFWKETNGMMEQVVNDLLSEKANTYSIVPNELGEILVIQEEKIILLDKNFNTRVIAAEHPIAGWTAIWLDNDNIATGSNDGIIIFDKDTGKIVQRINLQLNKSDWQFTSTRSLYLHEDGKLYCGLNAGLYVVDYVKIQQYNFTPQIKLDEIVWENTSPQKSKNGFKVPYGNWSVNIAVFAAWFIDEKQVKFRFKLVGFNENWTDLLSTPSIRFSSLPIGTYELICQSYTALTGFGKVESIITLNVYSPWSSVYMSSFISNVTIGYNKIFKAKYRNKILIEKNKDLQKEVNNKLIAEQALNRYKEQLEEIVENRTQELKFQKERAESADKMKTAFLSNMSHEIRTPISNVIGLNNLLQKTNPDEKQKNYINKINSTAQHLLQIINDLLDIAKIESGKMELEKIPFSLNTVLEDFYNFAEINYNVKNIDFLIEKNITTTKLLIGDSLRIKQILLNLLSNAFKFTESGSIKLLIKEIKNEDGFVHLKFSVKDTGIGMTDLQLQKIFEAFEQADKSITRKYGGTGLGLSICDQYLLLMESKLKVKSSITKGSDFYFTLKLEETKSDESLVLKKSDKIEFNRIYPLGFDFIRKSNILIVDDDILNQFVLKEILISEGFNIFIANNGEECLKLLQAQKDIDLILMDMEMPIMDGIKTTNYIRNELKNKDIKIIGISANAYSEAKNTVLENGFNDYLSKPVSVNELFVLMTKWIAVK
jgi:signal transduction histidine kinase/CheY-like chemotaxis protein/ligand-binding sensor domain-containing protein